MDSTKRNTYYDKLKGLAIILVVIGHSIQSAYPSDFDNHELFRLIYSFHMPLFMFISGIIAYYTKRYDRKWLKKKFLTLVIPFAVWIIIPFIVGQKAWGDLPQTILNIVKSPDNGLWFLWVLFLNCLMLFIAFKIMEIVNGNLQVTVPIEVISIIICFLIRFVLKYMNCFGINLLAWYSVFYFSGFYLAKYKEPIKKYRWLIGGGSLIIWLIVVAFWRRVDNPTIILYLPEIFGQHQGIVSLMYNYLVGFSGIGMVLLVVYSVRRFKWSNILERFGKRTIEIYILQWYFFNIFILNNKVIEIIINVVLGLLCPYLISEVFERKYERRLLFGKP